MDLSRPVQYVNKWLTKGVKQIASFIGNEAVVVGREWIEDRWNRLFSSKDILILGPKGTGKTSLVLYLMHGHPYEVDNGKKRPPNPTATAALVDEKFKLQHGNWQKVKKDVPGDPALRDIWGQAIEDVNPRGIIYMLDGRLGEDELLEETEEIRDSVLSHYDESLKNLAALHVFINFADHWAKTPEIVRSKTNLVRNVLERHVLNDTFHQHLRTDVSHTQLSPDETSWERTQRALFKFGADLVN